ncbi:MAG: putative thiol peroxidase [Fimbriimonadales bacterium]|nr:MAG: putative thiol peroxidase [Fimbriimonadales bacterium]
MERVNAVTFLGNPLTLIGKELKSGDPVPDATVIKQDLTPVNIHNYKGKVLLISVVPSLDTSVCSAQTKKFNEAASQLPDSVKVITVSMDLPFAQKRFCGVENIDKIEVLSDHREGAFGQAYGALVKELRILSRAVFVVDPQGIVHYVEYVPEIASHPNYDAALQAVRQLIS